MNNPWEAISLPTRDLNARRINAEHPLDLFWARNHIGQYLFIYEFKSNEDFSNLTTPSLAGITSGLYPAEDEPGLSRVVLTLNEQANWEIFYSLCMDVFHSTSQLTSAEGSAQSILRRLQRWHEFLKKRRSELLSEEQIKGLLGELIFLHDYLFATFDPGQAIKFWLGPEGFPQDFNVNNCSIEVKCQAGGTSPIIRVSSIDQLCSQMPEMYLFVVTLGKSSSELEGALNLPGLVSKIRADLNRVGSDQMERFNDLLFVAGYIDSERYLEYSYVLTNEDMFRVGGEFPRICRSEVHPGIARVVYDIDLSLCEPFAEWPDWIEKSDGA